MPLLPCIRCDSADAVPVDCPPRFTCGVCGARFTARDVRDLVDAWGPYLVWLELFTPAPDPEVTR